MQHKGINAVSNADTTAKKQKRGTLMANVFIRTVLLYVLIVALMAADRQKADRGSGVDPSW